MFLYAFNPLLLPSILSGDAATLNGVLPLTGALFSTLVTHEVTSARERTRRRQKDDMPLRRFPYVATQRSGSLFCAVRFATTRDDDDDDDDTQIAHAVVARSVGVDWSAPILLPSVQASRSVLLTLFQALFFCAKLRGEAVGSRRAVGGVKE